MDKLWCIHKMECYSVITCTQILTAALFAITKNWKQPKYPLIVAEWIKKIVVYPYSGIILSNTNKQTIDTCNKMDYSQNSHG